MRSLAPQSGQAHGHTRACAPDGREALYGDGSGEVGLLDLRRGRIVQRFGGMFGAHKRSVSCLAFDPDGLLALSGGLDGSVRLWDVESGKGIGRIGGHADQVIGLAFSPDGDTGIYCGKDGFSGCGRYRRSGKSKSGL